jgi:hypothetical protein
MADAAQRSDVDVRIEDMDTQRILKRRVRSRSPDALVRDCPLFHICT